MRQIASDRGRGPLNASFGYPRPECQLLELLQPLNSSNSFFKAFYPYNGPFIGKSCPSAASHVIDVAGLSTACLAKIVEIPDKIRESTDAF
jgi:hypothetical protein